MSVQDLLKVEVKDRFHQEKSLREYSNIPEKDDGFETWLPTRACLNWANLEVKKDVSHWFMYLKMLASIVICKRIKIL